MSVVQQPDAAAKWFLPGILVGLKTTFANMVKNLFNQKKMITLNYPEQKYEYGPRFKGNHVLTVKKDGSKADKSIYLPIIMTKCSKPSPKSYKFRSRKIT